MSMQAQSVATDWSRGGLEVPVVCPACGKSSEIDREYSRRDDMLAMPDTWHIVRCTACRSLYLAERPDNESLPRAYTDYYTHSVESDELASGQARGLKPSLVSGYLNWRFGMGRVPAIRAGALLFSAILPLRLKLDVYGRHLPREKCNDGTRLLDVGCGNGAFLARAREIGVRAFGCEPDSAAADACRTQGLDVTTGDVFAANFAESSFDYITLNHVIEHVGDHHKLLRELYRLLVPGGALWLALPNPAALGIAVFGNGWKGFHPPFHLAIPSQAELLRWLADAGFVRGRLLRRGAQSPGMWHESANLASREGTAPSRWFDVVMRLSGDLLSTLTPRWGEETIALAWKSPSMPRPV